MALKANVVDQSEIGYFRTFVTPPGGVRKEITFFRGVPINITEMSSTDPFTDASMQITCPQITAFDVFGSGDLSWLVPYADVDVIWENAPGYFYDWRFEGFIASTGISADETSSAVTLDVKGALYLLDNYLAAPTFPSQPVPYEILMQQAFDQNAHPAHLASFGIEWPGDVNGTVMQTYNTVGQAIITHQSTTKTLVTTIKVAQFNVYGGSDGTATYDSRVDNIANEMVRSGASVIGTEECSPFRDITHDGKKKSQPDALLDELQKHNDAWRMCETTAATPIFYRSDIVKKQSQENVFLGVSGKAMNLARFGVIGSPGYFHVAVIHPTNDSKSKRLSEIKIVIDKIQSLSHTIVLGDLNDPGDSGDVREKMAAAGFRGLRSRSSAIVNHDYNSHRSGLHGSVKQSKNKNGRWIDEILSKNELSLNSGGLDDNDGISDHMLLYASFSFTTTSGSTINIVTQEEDQVLVIPQSTSVSWDRRVPPAGIAYDTAYRYAYLRPWGVIPGQLWTGFTTRSTGGWENMLSGFIQGLLSVMFEEGGDQWSIRKDRGRKPVLYLRQVPDSDDPAILEVELGAPGVTFEASRDFTQSANVIFGEGSDTAGTTYSKARVSTDGQFTSYDPFASQASVWPVELSNPHRNSNIMPKEAQIKFPAGMDILDAESLSRSQINRFADPGFTGTITLKTDPRQPDGVAFPRMLIKAARSIRIKGLFGLQSGVLFHITQSSVDMTNHTVTLSVDSKYRDALTVAEVKARTRDALTPLRSLQVGKFTNTVQDLLLPWSYAGGSGIIPSGGSLSAADFFLNHLPTDAKFPYEDYTKLHPPSAAASKGYYIKIAKTDLTNSNNNWSAAPRNGQASLAIPIKMGQQGSIRLLQIAAYKADGSVFPVKFHCSIYSNNGTSVADMPVLQGEDGVVTGRHLKFPAGAAYQPGQKYPFFETAWETVDDHGQTYANIGDRYPESAGLVVGYGNFFEPAGYYPGRFSRGDSATGLLVDETQWSWDLTQTLDPQSAENTAKIAEAGFLYVMIYCDDQINEDIYFLGRCYRVEPGVQ